MQQVDSRQFDATADPVTSRRLSDQQEFIWLQQLQNPQDVPFDAILVPLSQAPDLPRLTAELPELSRAFVFDDDGEIRSHPVRAWLPVLATDAPDPDAALRDLGPDSWDLQAEPALKLVHLTLTSGQALAIIRHRILAETLPFDGILARAGLSSQPIATLSRGIDEGAASKPMDEVTGLILDEFRQALAAPNLGPHDDFFDHGGHSLTATRIIGRLQSLHGIELRFTDLFSSPTAAALAQCAERSASRATAAPQLPSDLDRAPLSLAQQSLWKAYAAFGYGDIFNIPFGLRFLSEVNETTFALAFRDLIERHPILRSHFRDDTGTPCQQVVPVAELGNYRWFWRSDESDGTDRRDEAGHVFDLARELPLRLRFFRDDAGRQELSLLFHHIALDEWSVNLLMDELAHAYRQRAAGLAPDWPSQPPGFHLFAAQQRASDPDGAHLAYWVNHLRGAPPARPLLGPRQPVGDSPAGGWIEMVLPRKLAKGLHATARRNSASLFNVVHAAIAFAAGRLGGIEDMVVGTSASGRNDPAFFDTIGYFTTMVAHRIDLAGRPTVAALIAQVRERVADSLPHSDIPLDLVGEAISASAIHKMEDMFEVFIQIHAQNKMNGAIDLMDGGRIEYRQIDPDKTESILGLQFEVLEDVVGEVRNLRIMMSYRGDHYDPDGVAQIELAVMQVLARFADADGDHQLLA